MPTIPTGRFVWFEYVSKDPTKAQTFFGELFNWRTQNVPMPQGAYTMIALNGQTIGGYTAMPEAPPKSFWLSHLQVASAQDSSAKVKAQGGKVMKDPFKVGDVGTMAVVVDPLGGPFALWQPAKVEGTGDYKDQPGNFVWNELYTESPEKSVAFYRAIGGFESEATKMGDKGGAYHLLKSDGKPRAGVTKSPMPGVPQSWMPYVQVASADQTADKAKRLGASILVQPTELEGIGKFAIFTDPSGATLGLLQPPRR